MRKILSLKSVWLYLIFALLDIICVGLGMGVPLFSILLGLPVGWVITKRMADNITKPKLILRKILGGAALTSAFTCLMMVIIWGISLIDLSKSNFDIVNFGIPMILYEPIASFIGWMVLMILISPFLQFLMTLFTAHLTWLVGLTRKV